MDDARRFHVMHASRTSPLASTSTALALCAISGFSTGFHSVYAPSLERMDLAILAGVGLVGGYRLATVAAQRWQEDAAEVLARGAAAAIAPSNVPSAAATAQSSKHAPKLAEAAVTLMLVGDSEVGKTLLCARLVTAAAAEALAHEAARTVAPTFELPQSVIAALARPVPSEGPFDSSTGSVMAFDLEREAVVRWRSLQV